MVWVRYNGVVILATRGQCVLINQLVIVDVPNKSVLAIETLVSELAQSVEVDTPDMLAHRALDQLRIRAGRSSGVSFSTHDKTDKGESFQDEITSKSAMNRIWLKDCNCSRDGNNKRKEKDDEGS